MLTDFERALSRSLHSITPEPPTRFEGLRNEGRHAAGSGSVAERLMEQMWEPQFEFAADLRGLSAGARRPKLQAGRASRNRVALAAVSAAVVVVALTVAATQLRGGTSAAPIAPGGSAATVSFSLRTLGFSIGRAAGVTILRATAESTSEQSVGLMDGSAQMQLDVYSAGASLGSTVPVLSGAHLGDPVRGLADITVNGRPGYYGRLDPRGGPSGLAWEYAPNSWATLTGDGSSPSKSTLLRLAMAVNADDTTSIRSPIRLSSAPPGMHLRDLSVTYSDPSATRPPYTPNRSWHLEMNYYLSNPGAGITIEVTTLVPASDLAAAGIPIEIGNHPGYWDQKTVTVTVDAGNGVVYDVSAQPGPGSAGKRVIASQADLMTVANDITLSTSPFDQASWFDAETAVP